MRFNTFLLDYEGTRSATLEDLKDAHEKHGEMYRPDGHKNLYVIETEIIEDRFFWLSCEYDDALSFREYVIDADTGEKQPNPRSQKQVEPRQQFFACYEDQRQRLFISTQAARSILQRFLTDITQKNYQTRYIYTSVDEFCSRIKTIKGFKFTQVNNLFARQNEIFQAVTAYSGLDVPNKLQMKVSFGDTPVHQGREFVDKLKRNKEEFEHIIVIGADDSGVEQTFDFSSIIEKIEIDIHKDETEHYDPQDVKQLLLSKLR